MNGPYVEPNPPRPVVDRLRERFPEAGLHVEEFRGEITVTLPAERLVEAAQFLRDDPETTTPRPPSTCRSPAWRCTGSRGSSSTT
jgi:hypothetical protein